MIAAVNYGIGFGVFYFLDNGRIIHCARCDSFIEHHLSLSRTFNELVGILGKSFAVVAFIMNNREFGELQCLLRKVGCQFGLCVIGSDCGGRNWDTGWTW